MTYIELTTLHYLKEHRKKSFSSDDLTQLVYIVAAIKRQPKRMREIIEKDSSLMLKNVSCFTKKFKFLKEFYLKVKDKLNLSDLEIIGFVCWYSFTYLNFKSFEKNIVEEDITNRIETEFRNWYKTLNENLHVIYKFKQSCKTIVDIGKQTGESCMTCLKRLFEQDKISELYYTGKIGPYFLAAIPKRKMQIPKTAIFTRKLFELIDQNRDLLVSKLNLACKNYLNVPVNTLEYLTMLES